MGDKIPFIFPVYDFSKDMTKGAFPYQISLGNTEEIETSTVNNNINKVLKEVIKILESTEEISDKYGIDELNLNLSINTEGEVRIGPFIKGGLSGTIAIGAKIRRK